MARGLDHHDPGNKTLNDCWPHLPLYQEGVHSADSLNYKSIGDALEQAAGISFCSATGERCLIHNNMGRLHFPSLRSRDAWARVWALFHLLGLGAEVVPECVEFAGVVAGHRIPWQPGDGQEGIRASTRGSSRYEDMVGLHGPDGEAVATITWGPDEDLYAPVAITWVRGLRDLLQTWQFLGTFFRCRGLGQGTNVLSLKLVATPSETFLRVVTTPPEAQGLMLSTLEAIPRRGMYTQAEVFDPTQDDRGRLPEWWNGPTRASGCGSGRVAPWLRDRARRSSAPRRRLSPGMSRLWGSFAGPPTTGCTGP